MTQEDQDAEVGRLVREQRDLRAHQQALFSKAQSTAKLLNGIGKALHAVTIPGQHGRMHPAPVLAFDSGDVVRVSDEYQTEQMVTGKYPEASEISQLVDDIKRVGQRLSELDDQLKTLGA